MPEPFDAARLRRLRGLLRLAEAAVEANAVKSEVWQYAVPIDVLRNHSGLTNADLQWLVAQGLVEFRIETTRAGAKKRTFHRASVLKSSAQTCFVSSPSGLRMAQQMCGLLHPRTMSENLKPCWNAKSGELRLGGSLVKRLPERADAQRAVLAKCQEEEWAESINSPFAEMPANNRGHYLGQVLNHLNSGQKDSRIHFSSINKGKCLRWKIIEHE